MKQIIYASVKKVIKFKTAEGTRPFRALKSRLKSRDFVSEKELLKDLYWK